MSSFLYSSAINSIFFINLITLAIFIFLLIYGFVSSKEKESLLIFKIGLGLFFAVLILPILSSIFKDVGFFNDLYTFYDNLYKSLRDKTLFTLGMIVLFYIAIFVLIMIISEVVKGIKEFNNESFGGKFYSLVLALPGSLLFIYAGIILIKISFTFLSTGIYNADLMLK